MPTDHRGKDDPGVYEEKHRAVLETPEVDLHVRVVRLEEKKPRDERGRNATR